MLTPPAILTPIFLVPRLGVTCYAAFFCCAFNFAHLARWNAAIFLRAATDIVRFTGADFVALAIDTTGCDSLRALAHLALCACAIFRREAADTIRVGFARRDAPEPFNDSITEIA
jgi:hypothetical protein